MAIQTIKATIQMRHGLEEDFDPDQMTTGEWAVSTDKKYVRMCFAPGLCIRMATYESFETDMVEIQKILATCQDIQVAVDAMADLAERHSKESLDYSTLSKSYAVGGTGTRENEDSDNAKYYSEQAKAIAGDVRVTGVKGANEETYRDGNVNITLDNIGAADGEIYGDAAVSLGRLEGSAVGDRSIAFGVDLDVSGEKAMSIGEKNNVSGVNSFSAGYYNKLSGRESASTGYKNEIIGNRSAAFGYENVVVDNYNFVEGCGNISLGSGSHAENCQNIAGAKYIFKIASYDSATKSFTFDDTYEGFLEAFGQLSAGSRLHIANLNYINDAYVYTISEIGSDGKSVIVNENIPTSNYRVFYATLIKSGGNFNGCHAEGRINIALNGFAHAEGNHTEARGYCSHAEGNGTKATANQSHASGFNTIANEHAQTVCGKYNNTVGGNGTFYNPFVIGNGTAEESRSNAFRVSNEGAVYGKGAYNSSGADYAEFIRPWHDGNENNEDRVGYFVTVKDGYLHKANEGDYIIGITSGNPSVVGNSDEEYYWRWERDEFNRIVYKEVPETREEIDEDGNIVTIETGNAVKVPKRSEKYDVSLQQSYVERKDRKEWDYVGMIGVIPVRDDGSCEVGRYCKCKDGGIATIAEERGFDTYMVLDRISDNIVSVILK